MSPRLQTFVQSAALVNVGSNLPLAEACSKARLGLRAVIRCAVYECPLRAASPSDERGEHSRMLRHEHFDARGGMQTFAALCIDVCTADKVSFCCRVPLGCFQKG